MINKVQEEFSPLVSIGGFDRKDDDKRKTEWAPFADGMQKLTMHWSRDYSGVLGDSASGEKINLKVGEAFNFAWMSANWPANWSTQSVGSANAAGGAWQFQTKALKMTVLSGAESLLAGSAIIAAAMLM